MLPAEATIEQQLPLAEPPRETNDIVSDALDLISASSNKIQNLEHEINRLRAALSGSAEVISEIEEQPMPPVVGPDYVVPSHMVADFVRIGRQLHKEGLVHADVGAVAILNPDEAGLMHTSSKGAILGQMTERHIASGRLGQTAPENAPEEWRMLEVLVASKSFQIKGPAACIYTHPPYATAISCEKDLIVLKPIDSEGITHLGNIVIVEPDADNPDEYLRHLAEALKQGNMKAVVVRGHGVFSTGADFDEAWRWASVIEHSMRVLMHARQANLQV
jgi:ribulose-5-phosphate 4-epimerase/fuculose-1-phosphate aldolase